MAKKQLATQNNLTGASLNFDINFVLFHLAN